MISDLLPSAGDEKRHSKGETEYSLSQLSKLHSLTHTHSIPPFHLPYLPLRATERGVPLLTKSQASLRESLRRTTPTTTTTTASETFDIHSSSYSHAPSSSLSTSNKREATTAAFRIPVGGIVWGGKSAPISSAIGRWSPFSKSARQQDTHPDSR